MKNILYLPKPYRKQLKTTHPNPVPWWYPECDKVFRLRTAKFKKWRFSYNLQDRIEYKKQRPLPLEPSKEKKEKTTK
ncbi:hypothetical protein TSAR_014976, partial [Trichomalopsis sarcophagae]